MPKALVVTITEGVELQPRAAFLASALRDLGFDPSLLPTDFCTTQESFQSEVTAADPALVAFVDGIEWREILVTLTSFARDACRGKLIVATAAEGPRRVEGFDDAVTFMADGDLRALARAAGAAERETPVAALPMDYGLYGGGSLLRRGMGASLFADVGAMGLLASRPAVRDVSPAAALARIEAPVAAGPFELQSPLAPLRALAAEGHRPALVEWWDRSMPESAAAALDEIRSEFGIPQCVRVASWEASRSALLALRRRGVTRVVFDCDALDEVPELRLPGAAGGATDVVAAVTRAQGCGLEVGILLVIGLPGENAEGTASRCETLRASCPERVRAVPFEPAGGTPAWDWCVARGYWPPPSDRWNRELYQPLVQAESRDWPAVLEHALMFVADVETRAGSPA